MIGALTILLGVVLSFIGSPAYGAPGSLASRSALPSYAFAGIPLQANHFDRVLPRAHRQPVILVHGTWASAHRLAPLVNRLNHAGFAVFTFNYGQDDRSVTGSVPGLYGTGPIAASARQLGSFVRLVRERTGAAKVDLVGHSQGGLVARRYLLDEGGAAVHTVVTLGSPHHGTTFHGLSTLVGAQGTLPRQTRGLRDNAPQILGPAALDQLSGSAFLTETNRTGDTVAGISYTAIITRFDQVVTPARSGLLTGPSVHNVVVQDRFPDDRVDHLTLPRDPNVQQLIIEALR
ncbi:lipase family alpha/beta hydrolase [Gordonia sp. CPCC 205333]|uniref:lipase family alpha/beta hydrolase n=1 Tax=Gordonia sp. CPCC 205333 TaxID=3140790 RepID=UPI003AF3FAA8